MLGAIPDASVARKMHITVESVKRKRDGLLIPLLHKITRRRQGA